MPQSPWRRPGVWVGFVGALLVGIGACSNGFSFNPDGWGVGPIAVLAQAIDRTAGNWLVMIGCLVLSAGWLMLVPRRGRNVSPWLWLLWSVPLLVVPPVMSGDPFLYADLGWIMANGGDPYVDVLGSMGGPFAPFVDSFWAGNGVAYPPLALEVNRLAAELGGMHPYWGVVAQRIPALVGMALLAVFLPKLALIVAGRRPVGTAAQRQVGEPQHAAAWAIWLGVANPIAIVHLVGGAHNDTLMAGVVVFAIWLSVQSVPRVSASLVLAPIVIGLAMALKQQAGLAVVAAAGLPVAARIAQLPYLQRLVVLGWRTAVATVVALGTFVAVSIATGLGFGWTQWMSQMGRARTLTLSVAIGDAFSWTGHDLTPAANLVIAGAAVVGLAVLLLRFPERPLTVTAWGSVLVLFVGQALHPWYVGLSLALLALLPVSGRTARSVVFVTIGYLIAYSATNLFNLPVLPSSAVGILGGLIAYAVWVALPNQATNLG